MIRSEAVADFLKPVLIDAERFIPLWLMSLRELTIISFDERDRLFPVNLPVSNFVGGIGSTSTDTIFDVCHVVVRVIETIIKGGVL